MLYAQFLKGFLCGMVRPASISSKPSRMRATASSYLAAFPFQGGGQNLIQGNRRILSTPMSIIVQLRLALG